MKLHIPKIVGYLKVLTDEEVKDFVLTNVDEYFKSTREKLYTTLIEIFFRNVADLSYSFLAMPGEVEK